MFDEEDFFNSFCALPPLRSESQVVTNEAHLTRDIAVLLDQKRLTVPLPASLKHEMTIETVVDESRPFDPGTSRVTSERIQLLSRDEVLATAGQFTIEKDLDSGRITLSLFSVTAS